MDTSHAIKTSPARAALLRAANTLFYRQGIRATSLEEILEQAGVARQSLYLHFSSKDGLIAEYLRLRDQRWRMRLQNHIDSHALEPRAKILAVFDFLAIWFDDPDFHGCAFSNAAMEYADPQHPFHLIAKAHKQEVQRYLQTLCEAANLHEPEALAAKLLLLLDGAIITEQIAPGAHAAAHAKQIATLLLPQGEQP